MTSKTETMWRTDMKQRRGDDKEYAEETGWMRGEEGNPYNNLKHLRLVKETKKKLAHWTSTEHKPAQPTTKLTPRCRHKKTSSIVCLQASKLEQYLSVYPERGGEF